MVVIRISQQGGVDMGNGKVKKKPEVFGTAEFGLCIAQVVEMG